MTSKKNKIQTNMLRERAMKLPDITDEMWAKVSKTSRLLVNEFIKTKNIRAHSRIQYTSALKQFFWWVYAELDNKEIWEITKRDFNRFNSYLVHERGMSSGGVKFKRSAVSSFLNYIEQFVADEEPNFKGFKHFIRGTEPPAKTQTYKKVKISYDEYQLMMRELEKEENYLGMCWLAVAFNIGARRSEIIQFKSEIANYEITDDMTYVLSHTVMGKGKGDGKPIEYMINQEALHYIKLWIEKRGYDHEYIFTVGKDDNVRVMHPQWARDFCESVLSKMLGRRINPHLFKASCITYLLESGQSTIEVVSKYVAQHNDISTTIQHYDLRTFELERNQVFKKKE